MTDKQYNNPIQRAKELNRVHKKAARELAGTDRPKSELIAQVGKQIYEKRKANRYSSQEVAALAGITFSHYSKIENGKENPTVLTLEKIAKALDMRLEINFVRPKAGNGPELVIP